MDMTKVIEGHEVPDITTDHQHRAELRIQIDDLEGRLAEARSNIEGSDAEIEALSLLLSKWKRFRAYQVQREGVLENRIRIEREQLRMEEDYASGVN